MQSLSVFTQQPVQAIKVDITEYRAVYAHFLHDLSVIAFNNHEVNPQKLPLNECIDSFFKLKVIIDFQVIFGYKFPQVLLQQHSKLIVTRNVITALSLFNIPSQYNVFHLFNPWVPYIADNLSRTYPALKFTTTTLTIKAL